MQRQPVPLEATPNDLHHTHGVFLLLEHDDEIVGIANEVRSSSKPRLHFALKPQVQYVMKVDVAQ